MGEAVLLVEEEAPRREHLSRQLADDGFDVVAADRAAEALALVESERPDLVLLDAVLPDGSGFEVCGRLRAGEPGRAWNRDVAVIMVTTRGDSSDRVRGFARGADDYVVRPFVYEELLARMRAVLRRTGPPAAPAPRRPGPRHRPVVARGPRRQRHGAALGQGVRPARRPGGGPRARVPQGGAPARRLGLQVPPAAPGRWTPTRAACAANSTRTASRPTSSTCGASGTGWSQRRSGALRGISPAC